MRVFTLGAALMAALALAGLHCIERDEGAFAGEEPRANFTLPSACFYWASTRDGRVVVCVTDKGDVYWHSESRGETRRIEIPTENVGTAIPQVLVAPDDGCFAVIVGPREGRSVIRIQAESGKIMGAPPPESGRLVDFSRLRGRSHASDGLNIISAVNAGSIVLWSLEGMRETRVAKAPKDVWWPWATAGKAVIAEARSGEVGCFRSGEDQWMWKLPAERREDVIGYWGTRQCGVLGSAGPVIVVEGRLELPGPRVRDRAKGVDLATGKLEWTLELPDVTRHIRLNLARQWVLAADIAGADVYSATTGSCVGSIRVETQHVLEWGLTGDGESLWAFDGRGGAWKRKVELRPLDRAAEAAPRGGDDPVK